MSAIVWASAVVIIAIFFMVSFRKDISSLLGRVREITRDGIRTSSRAPQQAPEKKESSVDELMKVFDSATLRLQEKAIQKDLEAKGLTESPDAVKILVRHLAATQLTLAFEKINSLIWGSQIRILEFLNTTPQGATAESLKAFYDVAASAYLETFQSYSYSIYMGFLTAIGLTTESAGKISISQLGVEFLSYLAATGRTGFRHL